MNNTINYIDTIDDKIKNYFHVLEKEYPTWLNEYINTDVLLKQQYISVSCGTIYSNLFDHLFFFSSLDHAIAVALICWHFTHDKTITLAGLFHDVATPVFKHCIDFLHGDYMQQEITEEKTRELILSDKKVMEYLRRDGIKVEEIENYHMYPIADNDTPMLSADRLEYSLSNALLVYNTANIKDIEEIYNDIEVQYNENDIVELGFKREEVASNFVSITTYLSKLYREDRTRYSMQFIADIIKRLYEENKITMEELYTLKEAEVIDRIYISSYANVFHTWQKASFVRVSKEKPKGVYYVHHGAKIRYIDPLVQGKRISGINVSVKNMIENNLAFDMSNYVYLDFKF